MAEMRSEAVEIFKKYSLSIGSGCFFFRMARLPQQHRELVVDIMPGDAGEEILTFYLPPASGRGIITLQPDTEKLGHL